MQVLPTNTNEESQLEHSELEQSQHPSQHQSAVDDLKEALPCTTEITAETKTPRTTVKRKMPSTVPSSSKIKKAFHSPEIDFMSGATEKLEDISKRAALITKEDSYDCCCVNVT